MRPRLTGTGTALLGGGGALAVGGLLLGISDLTRWGVAALALVALCAFVIVLSRPRVHLEVVDADDERVVGVPAPLTIGVRYGRWSAGGTVRLTVPPGLGGGVVDRDLPARLPSPRARRRDLDLRVRVIPRTRGLHVVPAPVVGLEDPFGLLRALRVVGEETPLLVLPRSHLLGEDDTSAPIPSTGRGGEQAPAPYSAPTPDGLLASVRPYTPGDDLRRVHWSLSAHRGDLLVRLEDPAPTPGPLLVLDPWSTDPGERAAPALEWAVEFLASVARALQEEGTPTGLLAAGPRAQPPCPPWLEEALRGEGDVGDPLTELPSILRRLALTPTRPETPGGLPGTLDSRKPGGTPEWSEWIGRASFVLLVAGPRSTHPTRALLSALSPAASGTLVVVSGRTPAEGPPPILDPAREAGWRTVTVSPETPAVEVWQAVCEPGAGSHPLGTWAR